MKISDSLQKKGLIERFLYIYNRINLFIKNQPFLGSIITSFIASLFIIFFNFSSGKKIFHYLYNQIKISPEWKYGFFAIIASLIFFVMVTTIYFFLLFRLKELKKKIDTNEQEFEKIDKIGLIYALNNDDDIKIQENLKLISQKLISSDFTTIDLLLTTGYEIISMHSEHENKQLKERYKTKENESRIAPFHSILKNTSVSTRILILSPDSMACHERGHSVIHSKQNYKNLIHRTIAYLDLINNENIQYGFYDMIPVWKIIKNRKMSFIQPLNPSKLARNEPWFGFLNVDHGITEGYQTLFEKKWKEKDSIKISQTSKRSIKKLKDEIIAKMN